jgi:ribosomal protein S18 acetylase RimI-like enzyme
MNNKNLIIREAGLIDLEQIIVLQYKYHKSNIIPYIIKTPNDADLQSFILNPYSFWEQKLKEYRSEIFVCTTKNKIYGYISVFKPGDVCFIDDDSMFFIKEIEKIEINDIKLDMQWPNTNYCILNQVTVEKQYRRNHIATNLIKEIFELYTQTRNQRLISRVLKSNKIGISFYEKNGFKIIKEYSYNNNHFFILIY